MNTVFINKRKFVLVPMAEYRKLTKSTLFPDHAHSTGDSPAIAFAEAAIAKNLVRDRESVGLSQRELAQKAGIRVEILNRAERGATIPSVRTLTKIENALLKAGLKRRLMMN